eukprot:8078549-Pyramimonas_sp.AAC.1
MSACGKDRAVLLKSGGAAVDCGAHWHFENRWARHLGFERDALKFGQHLIPDLPPGLIYTQVAVGHAHTALFRSDGAVVTCGCNPDNQRAIPALGAGLRC